MPSTLTGDSWHLYGLEMSLSNILMIGKFINASPLNVWPLNDLN